MVALPDRHAGTVDRATTRWRSPYRRRTRRNLEIHAWFNPYRVSMDTDRGKLAPDSPAARHPDWVIEYGGKLYYDPGVPQVRSSRTDVILEVVRRYDIDGVHFDDYFYPYPVAGQEFADDATFAEYGGDFADTGRALPTGVGTTPTC